MTETSPASRYRPGHEPRWALQKAGATDAQIEAFYTEARNADPQRAKQMIDHPSQWLEEQT